MKKEKKKKVAHEQPRQGPWCGGKRAVVNTVAKAQCQDGSNFTAIPLAKSE